MEFVRLKNSELSIKSALRAEKFLFPELLKRGAVFAKELGFTVTAVSNGFWGGKSDAEISEILDGLPVDSIMFSCDEFHRKYVPEENVFRVVSACGKHNISTVVSVGEIAGDLNALKFVESLGIFKYAAYFNFYRYIRVGKAENFPREMFMTEDAQILKASDKKLLSCEICQKIFSQKKNFNVLLPLINSLYNQRLVNSLFI